MSRLIVLLSAIILPIAVSADEATSPWRPMWNVVQWQANGFEVPLRISIEEPSPDAKKSGVTREMVERVVELGLRRNRIPSGVRLDLSTSFPQVYVRVMALDVQGDRGYVVGITYKVDFALQNLESIRPAGMNWGNDPAYLYQDYWTHGVLGYSTTENFPTEVRDYLSIVLDEFSLEFLKARDEVESSM